MAQKIRVGVVDQHPLFRDGIVFSLTAQPHIEVIGQGASMRDALLIAHESAPDVIVLDMSLLDRGLEAIEAITQQHRATKILLFTMVADEDRVGAPCSVGSADVCSREPAAVTWCTRCRCCTRARAMSRRALRPSS
jgi:DNA-binding NarL/FixJ family response regulator